MSSIVFPLVALFIDILIAILFFAKKKISNKETKIYTNLLIINIIECILDVCGIIHVRITNNIMLFSYIQKIDVLLIVFWVYYIFVYVYNISKDNDKTNNKLFYYGSMAVNIIFAILIIVFPINSIVTEEIIDSSGLAPEIAYISVGINSLGIAFCIIKSVFKDKKKIFTKKYIPLYTLILMAIIGMLLRKFMPNLVIEPFIMSYALLVMYFTIENPDVKAIAAIELAKDQAEKANAAKTDFLSSMSHEIRTPLNAIVGFSEAIQEEETLEAAKQDAKDIILASQNLLELVNGILDISKLEANKMEIVNNEYNIREECNNLIKLIKPRIGEKPINLTLTIAPDVPETLYGDKSKVKEIMSNLLTNAVKYTEKGSIAVNINCINKNDECSLMVSVEDTGRGIKPEKIDKLFNKFERLEEDRNTTIEGAGLGLAITKRLVELMDGRIVVQSVYGSGSKFTFYLKQRITKNKPSITIETTPSKLELYDKKVLIVDDNDLNIKIAERMLNSYGLTVETCKSGFECVDLIKEGKTYDLILMDDMMPKMSGVETLHILQEIPTFKDKVVVLTANAIEGMREKYLSDGFEDYLSKPIEKKELERVLRKFLNNEIEHANFAPLPEEMYEIADSIVEKLNEK